MLVLAIALAGAVGAPARYFVDAVVIDRSEGGLPLATFVINVSGSFVLGVLTGLALYHAFPSTPKTILGTGFCGAYTTFSTFTFETIRLLEEGEGADAIRYAAGSLVAGAAAAAFGLAIAAAL